MPAGTATETDYVVVSGKLKNLDFDVLDEWGMNVRITAQLRVRRVVKGRLKARVLTIRYITHSGLPEDTEIKLRLRRSNDGSYLLCSNGGRGYVCD